MVFRMLKEPFYYGEFEYPVGSGNWYKGTHKPLITKEIFDKARKCMKVVEKGLWGRKVFYFKRIFKCGACGSGISGETHLNRHGKLYNYYKCNKYGATKTCREKYIREEKLIESVAKIVDQIKGKHESLSKRLKDEVEKFNNLQKLIGANANTKALTIQDYIEYILKNGSSQEKSCLLRYTEGKLYLKDGNISLAN